MRTWLAGGLVILLLLQGRAFAAPAASMSRTDVLAKLCAAGGQDVPSALRQMLDGAVDASAADRDWAKRVVQGFSTRSLRCADDGSAFLTGPGGAVNAATLAPGASPDGLRAPLPSLRTRALLEQLDAALTLFVAPAAADRLAAVHTLERRGDGLPPGLLRHALDAEHDAQIAAGLRGLIVAAGLHSPDIPERLAAIHALGRDPTSQVVTTLATLRADPGYAEPPGVAAALDQELTQARWWVRIGDGLSLAYNGVSAGSVLFLSSVGLAIIFGLMGVINLAQGELIMIGAYATFCVQQAMRSVAPSMLDWYPLVAIPVVFVVTALVGVAMELLVIRHLYRRPLMTLLATWAISLLLVNLVRVGFGTQNLEFQTPSYLTGGVRLVGDFLVTWNHMGAIAFALAAFAVTLALLRLTDIGLFIRTVTQNRAMAGCVGISTRRIDMAAFGFGAGLAGLAGLALSPIYNVNPTMGTGFIIDSFMVVVLGGVGSLFGTAVASLGIGLVNVGIEPFYGAVAAKVVALLLVILLIQRRPEGLIALKGRR
ncbi:MAG: urea ABC transporter permease subunit UrtB [Acetobacteraceae bacterium]|nr:urea ABC transporter permease subunit UrtB [Acetobacteraceae bacterium]